MYSKAYFKVVVFSLPAIFLLRVLEPMVTSSNESAYRESINKNHDNIIGKINSTRNGCDASITTSIMKKCNTIMKWYMGERKEWQWSSKDINKKVRYVIMYVGVYM